MKPLQTADDAANKRLTGEGYSFRLYDTAEEAAETVKYFNRELLAHGCNDSSLMMVWAVLKNGGARGYIVARLQDKRILMGQDSPPFELSRMV